MNGDVDKWLYYGIMRLPHQQSVLAAQATKELQHKHVRATTHTLLIQRFLTGSYTIVFSSPRCACIENETIHGHAT